MHPLSCLPASTSSVAPPSPPWAGLVKPSTPPLWSRSYLADIPGTSAKFRDIVAYRKEDDYVGIVEVALGGTYCRCKFITEIEYHQRRQRKKVPKIAAPLATKKAGAPARTSPSPAQAPSSARSRAQKYPSPAAAKAAKAQAKRAQTKAKGRYADAVGKVSRVLVPASRRIRLTLTSLHPVPDAPGQLRLIAEKASKKFKMPDLFAVWRRAYQDRGVEHFHLQVYLAGQSALPLQVPQDVANDIIAAWTALAGQSTPPQVHFGFPSNEDDLDRIEKYDASQSTHGTPSGSSGSAPGPASAQATTKPKGAKTFGILRRAAYHRHVQVEEYVVGEAYDMFKIRRLLRGALNAEMRTWKRRRRHRPRRYQVEAKFHLSDTTVMQVLKYVMKLRHGAVVPLQVLPP